MKARQLVGALIVAAFFLRANELLWADNYTVAYDTVQASSFLALSNGFNGSRVTVAQVEADASPETNQIAFTNINFTFHQNDAGGAHATAVGSILFGRAPGFSGGVATGVTNAEFWDATSFGNQIVLSNVVISSKVVNQSWSYASYSAGTDAAFDYFIQQQKVIMVSGGVGTMTNWNSPGTYYNGITVGASDAYGNPSGGPVGPIQGGRSKPDLIAPRSTQVAASPSIVSNNFTFTNSSYTTVEGVSLSTPFVSGAAAILVDKALGTTSLSNGTDPRVVKCILMTSAKKMAGWSNSASAPLDTVQGAGLLQVESAYHLLVASQQGPSNVKTNGWDFNTVGGTVPNQTRTYTLDLTNAGSFFSNNYAITATLNWFEDVTNPSFGSYGTSLQNLDLTLKLGATVVQYSTSVVDNVEHIWFLTNAPGTYTLNVTLPTSTVTDYALSWNVTPVPEPSTLVLLLVTGVPLLLASRRFLESAR